MQDATYDTTVQALEAIVEHCRRTQDRAGYFAAMYLAVTRTIRLRAQAGRFADPARMERFVCHFASRYLDAHDAWRAGADVPACWSLAFDTTRERRPVVLQHLLLGINAHINLDLGVTAAAVGAPGALDAVRADFEAVNDVLGELVDPCQRAVGEVSPWIALCDRVGGPSDESAIHFSLVVARRQAWTAAVRLDPLDGPDLAAAVADLDRAAVVVGQRVVHPGWWGSGLLLLVRLRERANPAVVIDRLAAVQPPT